MSCKLVDEATSPVVMDSLPRPRRQLFFATNDDFISFLSVLTFFALVVALDQFNKTLATFFFRHFSDLLCERTADQHAKLCSFADNLFRQHILFAKTGHQDFAIGRPVAVVGDVDCAIR